MDVNNYTIEEIIEKAVDRALNVLGSSAKHALYYHLENTFGIPRSEIINNPEKFVKALYSVFGPAAEMLENAIIAEINELNKTQYSESSLIEVIRKVTNVK